MVAGLHPDNTSRQLVERGIQGEPLDLLAQNRLTGAVEPDQVERILADVDADNREVFKASCLLRTHGCFSFDADDPGSG